MVDADDAPERLTLTHEELDRLRSHLVDRPTWLVLARRLKQEAEAAGSTALEGLASAFLYDLVDSDHQERRERAGSAFASPGWSPATGAVPPPPQQASSALLAVWRLTRDSMDDPIVGARLGDLLFVATSGFADGLAAARAPLSLTGETAWSALDRARCISRALELAARLNNNDVLTQCVTQADQLFTELLATDKPGGSATILQALRALRADRRPGALEDMIRRYVERWSGTAFEEGAWGLAARLTGTLEAKRLYWQGQIAFYRRRATSQDGLGFAIGLQKALLLATQHGFRTERDEILKELQDFPSDAMGFESFTAEAEIDTPEIRAEIDKVVGAHVGSMAHALSNLGAYGPPGGSDADIDAAVPRSWVNEVFGTQVFAQGSGVAQFLASDPVSKKRFQRAQQRRLSADYWAAAMYGPALMHAHRVHGPVQDGDLEAFFATELIGENRAERFARGLRLFWDQEFDDAAHIVVPRIEGVLRDLARYSGIAVTQPPQEGVFTGWLTLGQLLSRLRAQDPELDWLDYLEAILVEPLGPNLRNNIAHGIVPRVGPIAAAQIIQAACFLTHIRASESEALPHDSSEDETSADD